jgi:serine/threonine-protein kinase
MTEPDAAWDRLSELFERGSAASISDQERLVRELADEDSALATRLDAMFRAAARSPLDRSPDQVQSLIDLALTAAAPTRIEGYRVLRLLGEGGMGRVYLVERSVVGGHAALKLLRDLGISSDRRARFAFEQQALARLSHPGIAQLYDVGTLDDGTPWFVMEYVAGTTITRRAAATHATVTERLELVREVCTAVQHAHAHTIIHRDIKPSNVLVTDTGQVKLLDFGIAKQLDPTADGTDTRTGDRMLTPAYAAPEQFSGGPLGVHTDVYAIGVLLYELLADRLPWSESDPARSDRPDPPALAHLAATGTAVAPGRANWRELDVLVGTAMHRDPRRRYPSVEALRRDIDHYLAGQPLEARPDTLGYRAARLLHRRWRELGLTAAFAVALVTVSVVYATGLARARDTARAEAARSARVQQFLMTLFQGDDEATGPADTLRVTTLIDRGVHEAAGLDADPMLRAEVRETLGELRRQLGAYASSDSLLSASLAERRRVAGSNSPDVARSLLALGRLRLDQARYPEADSLLGAALAIVTATLPADHPLRVAGLTARARVHQEQALFATAIDEQQQVLAILRRGDTTTTDYAQALVELANSYFYTGELDRADTLNRRALALFTAHRGDNHPSVADVLINLGAAQFERGDYPSAERFDRDALARIRAWYGDDHPETASALTLLSRALIAGGQPDEADSLLRRAMGILEASYGPVHPRVASALNELGTLALTAERYDDADHYFRRNLAIYHQLYGAHHWLIGIAAGNVGSVALARGDNRTAERWFREALDQFTATQGPDHLNTAIMQVKLGRALLRQRRYSEAVAASGTGYRLLMALADPPAGFVNAARTDLAAGYDNLGDHDQARRFDPPP